MKKPTFKHTVSRLAGEFTVASNKYTVDIPKGTRCALVKDGPKAGFYWVDDLEWINPENRMLKHDAYFYGILLKADQVA